MFRFTLPDLCFSARLVYKYDNNSLTPVFELLRCNEDFHYKVVMCEWDDSEIFGRDVHKCSCCGMWIVINRFLNVVVVAARIGGIRV